MHEIECGKCGKIVRGRSTTQARNNLKNHRVSHGDHNRLQNRSGGGGESEADRIRKETKELLRGNGRGRSSAWIAERISADVSPKQVGISLSHDDSFTKVGVNSRGSTTWELKEDVEEG